MAGQPIMKCFKSDINNGMLLYMMRSVIDIEFYIFAINILFEFAPTHAKISFNEYIRYLFQISVLMHDGA